MASSFASCTGLCWGSTNTAVPSRTRVVIAATYESRLIGSRLRLPPRTWSSVHRLSNPSASARRATRPIGSMLTGSASETCGSPNPNGIFFSDAIGDSSSASRAGAGYPAGTE